MDTKDFFQVFNFFGQLTGDTELDNPRKRLDDLLEFCSKVDRLDIEGYLYSIGETGLSRLENLKKLIWSSCKFISFHNEQIRECYFSGGLFVFKDGLTYNEFCRRQEAWSSFVKRPLDLAELKKQLDEHPELVSEMIDETEEGEEDLLSYEEHDGEIIVQAPGDIGFEEVSRLAGQDHDEWIEEERSEFKAILRRIKSIGELSIIIIDRYLSLEKDRPKSIGSLDELAVKLAPILSDELFSSDVDGERLKRILLLEEPPRLKPRKEGLAIHLLKLLELEGPDTFQENDWFKRALGQWSLYNAQPRLSPKDISKKRDKCMKRICGIVREVMQKDKLEYEEKFMVDETE